MVITMPLLSTLFAVGLTAGTVDAIAGGGGLLTLPALLGAGLPPVAAIATAKLQSTVGTGAAAYCYGRRGQIDLRLLKPAIPCTLAGAAAGALSLRHLAPATLGVILPVVFALVAGYFLFSPRVSDLDSRRRLAPGAFALLVGTGVGFYDGFLGPGTGTFFAAGFIALLGFNLRRATANTKILNLTSNITALALFIHAGVVVWPLGLAMAGGQLLGGTLGARLALRGGARLIRPLLALACLAMIVRFWAAGHTPLGG